jgi:two-component system, cell cycle sensor histidine kinase and response regulator CckA
LLRLDASYGSGENADALANSTKHDLMDSINRENKLQQQIQHSRSIGMPAVAIAHDFNNLLHVIQSYVTIMEFNLGNPKALAQDLEIIKQTVKDGTALTQQLLTGARKNKTQFKLNLCVNARDAMGDTGVLQLSTMRITGNRLRDQYPRAEDRDYVCIAVTDTGNGMDENVREHIFEPFFTTKTGR